MPSCSGARSGDQPGDPAGFGQAWHEGTEQLVAPFYWNQVTAGGARLAEMTALREGRAWSPADSPMSRLASAAPYDAGVFRALMETVMRLALPQEVIQRPGITDTIERLGPKIPPPAPGPGPSAAPSAAVRMRFAPRPSPRNRWE